ncbi:hypothetical protein BCR39DRAFT_553237 [Naematelia encephala]|uniref:Uncharacterized protein n=1 Tax=Naematelia encephala TaxID=71784 RepID=A0A1Y2AGL4_9TREE|nr:hypothetical protein BCR39DRAFT_553237 [Naematelia encephala]
MGYIRPENFRKGCLRNSFLSTMPSYTATGTPLRLPRHSLCVSDRSPTPHPDSYKRSGSTEPSLKSLKAWYISRFESTVHDLHREFLEKLGAAVVNPTVSARLFLEIGQYRIIKARSVTNSLRELHTIDGDSNVESRHNASNQQVTTFDFDDRDDQAAISEEDSNLVHPAFGHEHQDDSVTRSKKRRRESYDISAISSRSKSKSRKEHDPQRDRRPAKKVTAGEAMAISREKIGR